MSDKMIEAENLVKIYKTLDTEVMALQGLDLTVEKGELTAIIGTSGSGKSTFLNLLGGLDRPSAGRLLVDGKNLFTMNAKELTVYKRDMVGFVWQNNARNLLPYMTVLENIMLPMTISGKKKKVEQAEELLDLVGLSHKRNSFLYDMSGGEQQRIAIAIALANRPALLLADEPTGSVDSKTAAYISEIFRKLNKEWGQTILIVTHDVSLSKQVGRVVAIRDGKIGSERILRESAKKLLAEGTQVLWHHEEETQDEYAVVDRAGRIAIPEEMLQQLKLDGNRVRLESTKDGILICGNETAQGL